MYKSNKKSSRIQRYPKWTWLENAMLSSGFNQNTLSYASKTSRQLICLWISGHSLPSTRLIPGISKALNLSEEEMFKQTLEQAKMKLQPQSA
jgi:hypothetical protein